MKTVGITIGLTRSLWNTRKEVITESGFFVPKGIFEIKTRGVYGNALIKIVCIGLGGFMETKLMITPV